MHIEVLVEDLSGKKALELLIPKIIGDQHTFRIHSYKGLGHIPSNMKDADDPSKRILLTNLPRLLRGYGHTFQGTYQGVVVLVCDLDRRDLQTFVGELNAILNNCTPRPDTRFCIAIEEGEAWLLGDLAAIRVAYPNADNAVLASYASDSICGTWEKLADALYPGGSKVLAKRGWQIIGAEKFAWAEAIPPHMDVEVNTSPSFIQFRDELRSL